MAEKKKTTALAKPAPAEVDGLRLGKEIIAILEETDTYLARRLTEAAVKLEQFIAAEGWRAFQCRNLTEWREKYIQFRQFYQLRDVSLLLKAGVPANDLERMHKTNIYNLARLAKVKPAYAEGKWREKALTDGVQEYETKVLTELERIGDVEEVSLPRGVRLPKSAADLWDLAFRDGGVVQTVEGANGLAARVEAVLSAYLNGPSDEDGQSRLQRYYELSGAEKEEG